MAERRNATAQRRLLAAAGVIAAARGATAERAGEPIPDKFLMSELTKVTWSGDLADPFAHFEEARFENKINPLPHERMQFWEGDASKVPAHVAAQFRSVPKYLLTDTETKGKSSLEVAELRAALEIAEAAESLAAQSDGDDIANLPSDDMFDATPAYSPTYIPGTHSSCEHKDNNGDSPCDSLPQEFSWYAFHGKGMLSTSINQHNPKYCGASWLFAAASSLADRIKVARAASVSGLGPDIEMAPQTVLNCAKRLAGTCEAGVIHGLWTYINDASGVPFSTCTNYAADDSNTCTPRDFCLSCIGSGDCYGVPAVPSMDPVAFGFWMNGVPKIYIKEWGYMGTLYGNSVRDIQIEVVTRGPIACAVDPASLYDYEKGVIDRPWSGTLGHYVEVVGWGETSDGEEFWHVKNSWGEFWGERGMARIKRGVNSMGIESSCSWVVPTAWGTFDESYGSNFDAAKNSAKSKADHDTSWSKHMSGEHCGTSDKFPCKKTKQGEADTGQLSDDDDTMPAGDHSGASSDDDTSGVVTEVMNGTDPKTHRQRIAYKTKYEAKTDEARNASLAYAASGYLQIVPDGHEVDRKIGDTFLEQIESQAAAVGAFWNQELVENLWKRGLPDDYTNNEYFSGVDDATAVETAALAVETDVRDAPRGGPPNGAESLVDVRDAPRGGPPNGAEWGSCIRSVRARRGMGSYGFTARLRPGCRRRALEGREGRRRRGVGHRDVERC